MSDASRGMIARVIAEHRRVVYGLLIGLVINVLVFVLLVYPLQSDVANVEQRTRAAETALAAAQADYERANGTLTGRDRALEQLDTFYTTVLAPDLPGARRLTFARLAQMAEKSGLLLERRQYVPVIERDSNLTRLRVTVDLAGNYGAIRNFIHEIESAPEFVVIDSIGLTESSAEDGALRLSMELSTYFRNAAP